MLIAVLHLQVQVVSILYLLNKFRDFGLGVRRFLRVFVEVRFVVMEFVATVATIHDLSDNEGVCGNEDLVEIGNVSYSCGGTEGVMHTEATCSTLQHFVENNAIIEEAVATEYEISWLNLSNMLSIVKILCIWRGSILDHMASQCFPLAMNF